MAKVALSPGEVSLLRYMRKSQGPIHFRDLMRAPGFHGWDRDTLQIMAERLADNGMLDVRGDTLSVRHASVSERVMTRYLTER